VVEEAPAEEPKPEEPKAEKKAKVAIPPTPPAEEALASKPKRRGLRKKKDD
jgi:hypothetical protein